MKRTRFLAAMLGIGLVFGGCEQITGDGGNGTSAGTAYTSADGSGTRLVLEVPSFVNGSGTAYSALKIGEAFNYELYLNGARISSGRVTINSAASWTFTANSDGFTFMASYGTDSSGGGTLTFYGIINAVFKGSDIMPVIGVPAPVAPPSGISLSRSEPHVFAPTTVGEAVPEALRVTITNTGDSATGELAITLSDDTAFAVDPSTIASIAVNGTADFTVVPIAELGARDTPYTATVTVSGENGISAKSFTVSFTVTPTPADPVYSIELSKSGIHTFLSVSDLEVTITNTGNQPTGDLTVELSSSSAFTLSSASINSIEAGGKATFTVTPKTGLTARDAPYTATVTVSGGNGISADFRVRFTVNNPAEPSYSIGLSTSSLDFGSAFTGYGAQDALEVTITNTGNQPTGDLTVELSSSSAFTLSSASINSIEAGGKATFTVTPNNNLAVGTYTAEVTVSGDDIKEAQSFTVSFKVNPAPDYGISLNQSGTYTFATVVVGYGAQTAKSVIISNTGNQPTGDLTVALSSSSAFALSSTEINSIAAGRSDYFTVVPELGLAAGTYTADVTVSGDDITSKSFTVKITVIAKTYSIALYKEDSTELSSTSPLIFPPATVGYTTAPDALTVTVTNAGNQPTGNLTVSVGTDFEITTPSNGAINSIPVNGTATFTVTPTTGLSAGTHTATVEVSGGNNISASFGVSFTVASYGISLNPSGTYTFPDATAGYGAQTAKSVIVSNTGNQATGDLTVVLSSSSAFTLSATSIGSINAGSSNNNAFTVTPKTGLGAGTHTATVTVSGGNITSKSFTVSFFVKSYGISLDPSETYIFPDATVGYGAQTAKSVTINNTGNQATGNLTVVLSSSSAFTLSATSIGSINAGSSNNNAFTVKPNLGLLAGTYNATVTVSGTNITSKSFTVSFFVKSYGIALKDGSTALNDSSILTFDWSVRGYTGAPDSRTIDIFNTGNQPTGDLTVARSDTTVALPNNTTVALPNDTAFAVTPSTSIGSIEAGDNISNAFTVTPKGGLSDGTYTATVTVSGGNNISASFDVSFTVYTAASFAALRAIMTAEATAGTPAYYTLPNVEETYNGGYTLNSTTCPAEVTIDGGGRDITGNENIDGIVVSAGITLTVTNLRLHSLKFSVDGTLKLGDGLFMSGDGSGGARVTVRNGGELEMREGAHITQGSYGCVVLFPWGSGPSPKFTMTGGKITGVNGVFGGVYMRAANSVFTMSGGEISGNRTNFGGGVNMEGAGCEFTMSDGEISGNRANNRGGGVIMGGTNSKFNMSGGKISSNTADSRGGGVALVVAGCVFNMSGGEISGNSAGGAGGVYLTGGTLTGDPQIGGTAPPASGGWIHDNSPNNTNW